jgi:phosphate transport system substrate-binding protein
MPGIRLPRPTLLRLRVAAACAALSTACGGGPRAGDPPEPAQSILVIDGSSTVYPTAEAVAEVLLERGLETRITVGISGTGGGLRKLCAGESTIATASRPIRAAEEAACAARGVAYIELPIGWDGVAVVVNPANTWARALTVAQLRAIWAPAAQGTVTTWRQVDPSWPDEPIHLYGAGVDSGTYDYFTRAVVGSEHSSRGDFTSSEDDNILVQGIRGDRGALGFMGLDYTTEAGDSLRVVPIDDGDPRNGSGPVLPTAQTVADATYQPLTRPVFVYVRADQAKRPDVQAFVRLLLGVEGRRLMSELGEVALSEPLMAAARARFDAGIVGTMFSGGSEVGVDLAARLGAPAPAAPTPAAP